MTTVKQDIEACFGDPTDYVFDVTKFLGRNRGLINVLGLRYQGLIAAGRVLRIEVEKQSSKTYRNWDFMHAMAMWCAEYTDSKGTELFVNKRVSIRDGVIKPLSDSATYFCIPPELDINIKMLKETG